jgi:hypothetical protein
MNIAGTCCRGKKHLEKVYPPDTHYVKSWTTLFPDALAGHKTHDVRVMDRDYKIGDFLVLQEYNWGEKVYTGRTATFNITYITSAEHAPCAFSPAVLHPKYCILSIKRRN